MNESPIDVYRTVGVGTGRIRHCQSPGCMKIMGENEISGKILCKIRG